jgi:hypothetical protein
MYGKAINDGEDENARFGDLKTHTGNAYIFFACALIGYVGYFFFPQYFLFDIPLIKIAAILSWLGLTLAGLILLLVAIFPEAFAGAIDKLFGGGGGNNEFNPKGIFDHIRNYVIAGTFYYSGTLLLSPSNLLVRAYAVAVCILGITFIYINYKHGKRSISKFLDETVDANNLTGLREKIWKSGFPKWPVYLFLPILSTSGFMHVYLLFTKT